MTRNEIIPDVRPIQAAILQWPKASITGGQIASLIRSSAPDLNVRAAVGILKGSGALTEFVARYLSDQLEYMGKQGMDTLYHLKGREIETVSNSTSPEIWRTFVSPNSKLQLVLNRSTGLLLSRDSPASPPEEIDIPKATTDEHDEIRAEFIRSLPDEAATDLGGNLSPNTEFGTWITSLRSYAPEEIRRWGALRRKRLSELLAARLHNADIDASIRAKALAQAQASEAYGYLPRSAKDDATQERTADPLPASSGPERKLTTRARLLAHAAIDRLSYDELRALKIPLGALLDAAHGEP